MYDYKTIVSDIEIGALFHKVSDRTIKATSLDGSELGTVNLEGGVFTATDDDLFMKYKLYQTRPELSVGVPVNITGRSIDELMSEYEERLIGTHILHGKYIVTPESKTRYERMIDWLRTTDFFRAPASSYYHESFVGGLLVHTLNVYNRAIDLLKTDTFKSIDPASVTLVALTHDWCKIGLYESYKKNVKNDQTGKWDSVDAFRRNTNNLPLPLGHGATSMYIASKFFALTADEALAIRWHMGEYNIANVEMDELHSANAKYPLCYLIQFADRISCTEYGTV